MRTLSPILASLANIFRIPMSRPTTLPTSTTTSLLKSKRKPSLSPFSTTTTLSARKGSPATFDKRITLIRYFLHHPLTPRPLRFSRTRYLRHWTIQRAWNLHQATLRRSRELELQRQYQAMSAACEELRTGCGERGARLFRIAMNKRAVYTDLFPIEYGRLQTEWPSRDGWNHAWKKI